MEAVKLTIVITLLVSLLLVGLYKVFKPTIDIIHSNKGPRVLLWYNYFNSEYFERRFVILYNK